MLEVSGGEQVLMKRRKAAFDQSSENNQNSSKTPSKIQSDFELFQKIIVSGMRVSFFKKVQFFSFARSFLLSINLTSF